MESMTTTPPLVVIVGPTASGKSALAMDLARLFDGELICADSRTVYKYLDIGTAKPSKQDQQSVPHHLLDVVEPDAPFTAADFKLLANQAIQEIADKKRLPIMVGGSGLYIDAVLYDYGFSNDDAPRDDLNPRHLAHGVERIHRSLRANTLVLGIKVERELLRKRIEQRVDEMVEAGFVDEVKLLEARYPNSKALLAPGYKAFSAYIDGRLKLDEAKVTFVKNDFQLAKRQMTWFRRNKSIHWLSDPSEAQKLVADFMNKNS